MGVARVIYYNRKWLDDTIWMHTQIKANNNNNNNSIIYPRQYYCYSTTLFFYKNIFYKNIEAEIGEILRIF